MPPPLTATVIGDIVDSRGATDRGRLHRRLATTLSAHADDHGVLTPPEITAGDEFQATYSGVGAAIDAAWRIRLELLPDVDLRVGIGWGEVTALDHRIQDGPGWWSARAAIEAAAQAQAKSATRSVRTGYRSDEPSAAAWAGAVEAALRCRDHLLGSLDDRSVRILGELMAGRSQGQIADTEGISASAISQRVRDGGLGVLIDSAQQLASVGAPPAANPPERGA